MPVGQVFVSLYKSTVEFNLSIKPQFIVVIDSLDHPKHRTGSSWSS